MSYCHINKDYLLTYLLNPGQSSQWGFVIACWADVRYGRAMGRVLRYVHVAWPRHCIARQLHYTA